MIELKPSRAMYAESAEKSMLGAMMISTNAVKVARGLAGSDFWGAHHQKIFSAMRALDVGSRPIDLVTVDEELGRRGELDAVGGTDYLVALTEYALSGANAPAYAQEIKNAASMRRLRDIGEALIRDATDPGTDIATMVDTARGKLRQIATSTDGHTSMADEGIATFERLELEANGGLISYSLGVDVLNARTGGMRKGEQLIIGGLTGAGKSALGFNIALANGSMGIPVVYVSLEMSKDQLMRRAFSSYGVVDGMRMRTAKLTGEDWERLGAVLPKIGETRVNLITGMPYIEDIRMQVQGLVDRGECDMLIVDYLQLMDTKKRTSGDAERIGNCSRMMKLLALEFDIPVVLLAQLNRDAARSQGIPKLNQFRGTGQIEQDADTAVILYCAESADDDEVRPEHKSTFEVMRRRGLDYIVADVQKQRQGQVGRVRFAFDPAHMRYERIPE